jgi:hypothetical protein
MQSEIPEDIMATAKAVVDRMPTHAFKGDCIADVARAIMAHAAISTDAEPVKPLHENDAVWARFYRDGKSLGEICEEFKCGVYDLSPWLTAPLARDSLSAQVQDVAGWQLVPKEPTNEMIEALAESTTDLEEALWLVERYAAMLAAAPAKQEGQP